MPIGEKQTFRFGPFELARQCAQLRKNGVGLKLQGQPVQILEILLEKPRQLVTREELRQRLWAFDTFVDFDHSLNTAVKKLRQALGDEVDAPRYIETLPKRGYRFIGEVVHEEPKPDTQETAAVSVLRIGPLEPQPANRVLRRKWVIIISALALLVSATGAAAYFALKPEPRPRIIGSHILTKTGYPKVLRPVVDRSSVYFDEERPADYVTMQVSTAGGELRDLPSLLFDRYHSRRIRGALGPLQPEDQRL